MVANIDFDKPQEKKTSGLIIEIPIEEYARLNACELVCRNLIAQRLFEHEQAKKQPLVKTGQGDSEQCYNPPKPKPYFLYCLASRLAVRCRQAGRKILSRGGNCNV